MAGLLSGLAAGLNFYANELASNRKEDREIEVMRQKMLMANQLEMDLLKQKQAFAQQFPEYKHFEKTLSGKIVGFNEQGGSQILYTPDDAEAKLVKDAYETNQLYKQNQADLIGMRARQTEIANPKPKPVDEVVRATNLEKLIAAKIAHDPSAQLPINFLTKKPYTSAEEAAQDDPAYGPAYQAATARQAAIRDEVMKLQGQVPLQEATGLAAPTGDPFQDQIPTSDSYDPNAGY